MKCIYLQISFFTFQSINQFVAQRRKTVSNVLEHRVNIEQIRRFLHNV